MEILTYAFLCIGIISLSHIGMSLLTLIYMRKQGELIYKIQGDIQDQIGENDNELSRNFQVRTEVIMKSQAEIIEAILRLEKNFSDLNIRMHVTEARLDERKNVTINQPPIQGSPARKGWPKGKPRKPRELEQK